RSQESNLPELWLTASRVRLARLTGMELVEKRGNAPRAAILQGSPAPLCFPRPPSPFGLWRDSLRSLRYLFLSAACRAVACEASEGWCLVVVSSDTLLLFRQALSPD